MALGSRSSACVSASARASAFLQETACSLAYARDASGSRRPALISLTIISYTTLLHACSSLHQKHRASPLIFN